MKQIKFGSLSIPITEFASQGNAILGIRDSGKSYTATWLAEQLLEAGIPFVAFDPIGVWKYLRVKGKGKGYPVVVAGGQHADLPLTPHSAPEIVRAAMRENIPLVIDLYDIKLSKSDWKQIVEQCVRILLYENGEHGLRHVFIEEAAEFAPQRVGPDQGKVYAEIEKLARMGGNSRLGYTLINQRAEEVNKAVLELCDCLFLHRQKGRNSLTALSKWLDIGSVASSKPIIESLPLLPQGDCWVWTAGSNQPLRVHIPEKNSFHPDRRATSTSQAKASLQSTDVTSFVSQMSASLEKHLQAAKENDPAELRREIMRLRKELAGNVKPQAEIKIERVEVPIIPADDMERLQLVLKQINEQGEHVISIGNHMQELAETISSLLQAAADTVKGFKASPSQARPETFIEKRKREIVSAPAYSVDSSLSAPQQRILDSMAWMESVGLNTQRRTIIAFLSSQSPRSSGYTNNLGSLRAQGLITYPSSDTLAFTDKGRSFANQQTELLTPREVQDAILSRLPRPQAKILKVLIDAYPESVDRETLAEMSHQSPTSSGYTNNLGALRSLGVMDYDGPRKARALPILFLE